MFLFGISVLFTLRGKETMAKLFVTFFILLLTFWAVLLLLQRTGFFSVVESTESLQAYLERAGLWMPIFYILLQFLQVVVLPIPSIVSTAAGVALFGAFWTMIYSLIGILTGSILAFIIGRKLGYRAVGWIVGKDALKKWQKKLKGKDNLFLSAMFILPFFPDDILCFVAGLSSMSFRYFITVIGISRIVGVAATCYSFGFIPFNTWWGITIWAIILAVIVLAFVLVYKNMEKIQAFIHRKKRKKQAGKSEEI